MNNAMRIRKISANDDYECLLQLMNETARRFNPDPAFFGYGLTAEQLREDFADPASSQGFAAEEDGEIIAFMGVQLSPVTRNGNVLFGFAEGREAPLADLAERCLDAVRDNGGAKMYKFAFSKIGQIRNSEITFWEKLGFQSEEYANMSLALRMEEWQEPADADSGNISVVTDAEREQVMQLLIEDGESAIAEIVSNTTKRSVILALRDEKTSEIAGLTYYFVDAVNQGTDNEMLDAYALTLHFRPEYALDRAVKQKLLHAALLSAKQLGVQHVMARLTLKDMDTFVLMIREGFDDPGMEKNSTVRLYRTV